MISAKEHNFLYSEACKLSDTHDKFVLTLIGNGYGDFGVTLAEEILSRMTSSFPSRICLTIGG